jgi:hypothetical protein
MAQGLGENLDINIGVNVTGLPQIQQVQTRMKNLNNTIQKSTSQYNANVVATNKWAKGALQQAGYQIGDYAVQVANGTSRMQAFGQQGSQLLGIFGPVGAVLGAAVAIFSAFGVAAQRSGKSAKTAAEGIDELASATSKLQSLNQQSTASFSALRDEYGALTDRARSLLKIQREIAEVKAIKAFGQATSTIIKSGLSGFDTLNEVMIRGSQEYRDKMEALKASELENQIAANEAATKYNEILESTIKSLEDELLEITKIQDNLKNLADFMGVTEESAKDIAVALSNVSAAKGAKEQAKAMADLAKSIYQSTDGLQNSTEGARTLYDQLLLAALEGLNLSAAIEAGEEPTKKTAKAASSLSKELSGAALAAQSMARALASAPNFLSDMKGRAAVMAAEIGAISAGLSEAAASSAAFRRERELHYNLESATHFEQRQIIEQNIEAEVRQFEANQRLNATLTDMRGLYKDVGKAGGGAMEKIKQSVSALTPEMQRLKDLNKSIEGAFETGFMSIIDGTSSVADAFRSMASSIIKELYRVFVVKRITGFISDAIGFAALPAGGTYTGSFGLPSFSGGGYTGAGERAGGLDGKGGFMAMLHPRETVVDHTKGQGGGVIVNQTINVSTGVQQTVRTEIKQLMPQIADAAKSAVVDAKLRGGSYGRAFA